MNSLNNYTLLFIFLIGISTCTQAKFNHPAEGSGGILIGTSINKNIAKPEITISQKPDSIDEGTSKTVGIKFTSKISETATINILSENSALVINGSTQATIKINPEQSLIDNNITLLAIDDGNTISEDATISISTTGYSDLKFTLKVNDLYSRKVNLSLPSRTNEDISTNLFVSLGIKPESNTTVTISSPDSAITFPSGTNLNFTPSNYDQPQSLPYIINDIYNVNKNYQITASSNLESSTKYTTIEDNDFFETDISTLVSQGNDSGNHPSLIIDPNNNILIATHNKANLGKPSIFKCDSNGSNCNHFDVSAGQGLDSGRRPSVAIDKVANQVVIITLSIALLKCDLSIANCISTNFSMAPGQIRSDFFQPRVLYPKTDNSIIFINDNNFARYCDGNFANCEENDTLNPNTGNYAYSNLYSNRKGVVDTINSKIITSHTNLNNYTPSITRWDINTANAQTPIVLSTTGQSAITTDIALDTINSKILVASSNFSIFGGRAWLFRCDLNGTNCVEKDVSGGILSKFFYPRILFDAKYQKVWVIFYDITQFVFYASRCDLTGDNCTTTQIFKTKKFYENMDEPNFDAVIDEVNDRILLAFTDLDTKKLILLRFGLGGF